MGIPDKQAAIIMGNGSAWGVEETLAGGEGTLFREEDRALVGTIPSASRAVKRLPPGPIRTDPTALPPKAKTPGEARPDAWRQYDERIARDAKERGIPAADLAAFVAGSRRFA